MTKEELQKTYSNFSNQELLAIIDNKFKYTELTVTVALDELGKRNLSEQDIADYKDEQVKMFTKFVNYNIHDDLNLFQKNFFFFLWFPLFTFPLKQNFREDGHALKIKQANYYSLLGFIFSIICGVISAQFNLETLTTLAIWIVSFLIAYTFDEFFNRQKQIEKLKKLLSSEEENENTPNESNPVS